MEDQDEKRGNKDIAWRSGVRGKKIGLGTGTSGRSVDHAGCLSCGEISLDLMPCGTV